MITAPKDHKCYFYNPEIDISGVYGTINSSCNVFGAGGDGGEINVIGGKIVGSRNDIFLFAATTISGGAFRAAGFDYGICKRENHTFGGSWETLYHRFVAPCPIVGGPDSFNFAFNSEGAFVDFQQGQSWPYLNATLPNATNEGWSYRVKPIGVNSINRFSVLPPISKVFSQTAATRKITLEFLINEDFEQLNSSTLFMFGSYEDSGGNIQQFNTFDPRGLAVTVSTANWQNDSFLGKSYIKVKLEHTTANPIKEGSVVFIQPVAFIKQQSSDDYYFYCPDPVIGAP